MPALAVADSPRLIQVSTHIPSTHDTTSRLPDALVEMFLRELSTEPHSNDLFCDSCDRVYTIAAQEGKSCIARQKGGRICLGKVTRRWTKEKAYIELVHLMVHGGVAIAWELGESSTPVALAVCEAHRFSSVIAAIDFPMNVLVNVYGRFGRKEPFLVFTHLSTIGVIDIQRATVLEKLVKDAAESMMGLWSLSRVTVLIPVSTEFHSQERQALDTMLCSKQVLLARDQRSERRRELWGFELRVR